MRLYDADFCNDILYAGWGRGVVNNLRVAQKEIKQNFHDMDLENASVMEEMQMIVDEMIGELEQLIQTIESVRFE